MTVVLLVAAALAEPPAVERPTGVFARVDRAAEGAWSRELWGFQTDHVVVTRQVRTGAATGCEATAYVRGQWDGGRLTTAPIDAAGGVRVLASGTEAACTASIPAGTWSVRRSGDGWVLDGPARVVLAPVDDPDPEWGEP